MAPALGQDKVLDVSNKNINQQNNSQWGKLPSLEHTKVLKIYRTMLY